MEKDKKAPRTLGLLAKLPKQIINLAKIEIANAKAEISARLKRMGIGVGLLLVALMIFFWTIATLMTAAVAGLATVWPVWLSALVVSAGGLLVTVILVFVGIIKLKRGTPVPAETIERVQEDIEQFNKVKKNAGQVSPKPGVKGKF